MIHQSLKLNNILIGKEIAIADFGLAKIISPQKVVHKMFRAMAEGLESEGIIASSKSFIQGYAFLSPEQKRYETVGVQTDTYAFGVIIYYLIAGQFPEGVFEMPSMIAPEFLYDWDQAITHCLAQDPRRRPTRLSSLLEKKRVLTLKEQPLLYSTFE